MGDDRRRRRDDVGFLWRRYGKRPKTRGEGRISVDAREYVRAHPQAATLTVGGCTIGLSAEAPQLATIRIPVSCPGPFTIRITATGADGGMLLDEKLRLDATQPSFIFKPHVIPSANVTIGAHGGLTVKFLRDP